jgi:hypothetical protein
MLEGTVELLGNLLLVALTLLIGACIVGSIIAALRAVNRGSATATPKEVNEIFGFVAVTRMTAPTMFPTEGKFSEEMQYGWRRAQELERVGQRRTGGKGSR